MTTKITKIGLILVLMGIGALAAYFVYSFYSVGAIGIILFDLLISVFLTMFYVIITERDFANFSG
jgi:hypothetical protein